jgi:NitT/TauT family transport system permease protein/taurine transport system permease protein
VTRAAAIRWGWIVAFVLFWEGSRRLDLVNPIVLASPTEVWRAWTVAGDQFLAAFRVTVMEIAVSIAITWTLGIATGLVAGSIPVLGLAAGPILSSLFAIPLVVWYPLFMVWVGLGSESKVLFAVVSGFFPIALNTMYGVRLLDRNYVRLGRSFGASPAQIVLRILVPLALPAVISGLRVGTALIVIGVVVSEMLASLAGIGFWVSYHRTLFNTGHVYLGIGLALCCVLMVNWGLSRLERHFGRWRELERREG